jgi:hypothetical protein
MRGQVEGGIQRWHGRYNCKGSRAWNNFCPNCWAFVLRQVKRGAWRGAGTPGIKLKTVHFSCGKKHMYKWTALVCPLMLSANTLTIPNVSVSSAV